VKNPEYGVISPVHLTGNKQHFDRGFINYFCHCSETFHAYENLFLKNEPECYDSRFVNAAAWLVTKNCLETVGGFDTILFRHYGEDDNYCHRVLYHRLKIAIITSTTICHDRENRKDKPLDKKIGFSIFYANILKGKKTYLKHLIMITAKIASIKQTKSGFAELFFLIGNIHKIIRSRRRNKIKKEGFKYI
jgi:GT2 family glycosyltransferase